MLQLRLLKNEEGRNVSNETLIKLEDNSLSPVAEAGDFSLVAQLQTPQPGDLLAYKHKEKYFVRWWQQDEESFVSTDADGENEQKLPFADVLVLGVVIEIRRPIVNGWPPTWDQQ